MSARLFVAVEVGEEDRAALAAWAREAVGDAAGMRLVPAANIHLTLAFLGHRGVDEVPPLSALVEGFAGQPAPRLRTAGALWLSPRRPHVLTVAVDDAGGRLAALHDRLWTALEDGFGLERERRAFRPHLTVARVRHGWTAPSSRGLPELAERELRAGELVLFRSWLGGGPPDPAPAGRDGGSGAGGGGRGRAARPARPARGARYEALVRAPLSAGS